MKKLGFFLVVVFAAFFAAQNAQAYRAVAAGLFSGSCGFAHPEGPGANGYPTRQAAENGAMATCSGNFQNCRIAAAYVNTNVYVACLNPGTAAPDPNFVIVVGTGATRAEAVAAAVANCNALPPNTAASCATDASGEFTAVSLLFSTRAETNGTDVTFCDAGQFTGTAMCEPCTGDSITAARGANGSCTQCTGGKVANTAKTMCACPTDESDFGGTCEAPETNCDPGQFVNTTTNRCENCIAGEVSPGGAASSCTACTGALQVPNMDNSACVDLTCDAGQFANTATKTCDNCTGNTHTPTDGHMLTSCTACTGGMEANTAKTTCACPDDESDFGGTCEVPMTCNIAQFVNAQNMCEDCAAGEVSRGGTVRSCTPCTGGVIPNRDNTACINLTCDAGEFVNIATNTCAPCTGNTFTPTDGHILRQCTACQAGTGLVANTDNTACECPGGEDFFSGINRCETPKNCRNGFVLDDNNICVDAPASLSCGAGRFIRDNGCHNCEGNSISPGGAVTACTPCTGGQIANEAKTVCETPPSPPPPPQTSDDDGGITETEAFIGMGALVLSGALIHGGGLFTFSPDYAFSHNGINAFSYGGKLRYENGNFSAFWQGGENNGDYYSEGIEYAKDFWRAGYTARLRDGETDWDLYADMEYGGLRSGFNAGWISGDDSDAVSMSWRNSMEWQYADWQITPSANLFWYDGGDNANFRVNLRREF